MRGRGRGIAGRGQMGTMGETLGIAMDGSWDDDDDGDRGGSGPVKP